MVAENLEMKEELRVIPMWAYIISFLILIFGLPPFVLPVFQKQNPQPLSFLLGYGGFMVIAGWILLLGYVIRDATRRHMNSSLWAVLVLLIPNAIGFIIYFLLRHPLLVKCPQCLVQVQPNANYCPACKYELRPSCPKCACAVDLGNPFCPQCGFDLKRPRQG